jgi:hypothetical protein
MSEAQSTRALQQFLKSRGNLHDVTCRVVSDGEDLCILFEDADWCLNGSDQYDGANPASLRMQGSHVLCNLIDDVDDIWISSFYVSDLTDGMLASLITNDGKAFIYQFDRFKFTAERNYAKV